AEDGIRDLTVTGVQTCALPICLPFTMRMVKGKLQFADLHADRLQAGMKALKMEGYSQMDEWFLKDKAADLSTRNKLKNGRLRLRSEERRVGKEGRCSIGKDM